MKRIFALLAVMALLLAACGTDTTETTEATGGTETTETTEAPPEGIQAAANACEVGATDGPLNLYNWTDYIPTGPLAEEFEVDDLLAKFEEEHGEEVTLTFFNSNEAMLAQIDAGASYDVVVPSDYMVVTMRDADLLVELNRAAIPNLDANIAELFSNPGYDPGNRFSAPYQWGTTGIGYLYGSIDDTEGVSWGVLFDEEMAAPNAGFISLLDDTRETLGSALKYLGYSLNTLNKDEVDEAADLILSTNEWIAAFNSTSYWTLLSSGEVNVSQGWNGDFLGEYDRITEYDADGEVTYSGYDDFGYAIPIEGSAAWVDTMAIPTTADHPCTAQTFINFILDAENGATLTNFNYYASPNEASEEFIYEEIIEDPSIYPVPETMAILEFFLDLGDMNNYYADAFTRAKG
ncbi:MAG: spermidine/putrescine ABC transporter substrate-binding protein [Acidobacteria bacterium]|nr:spermidine/putrescine ABC transporter substrate-binding protein [Acidobacteriota bacterium]